MLEPWNHACATQIREPLGKQQFGRRKRRWNNKKLLLLKSFVKVIANSSIAPYA
jgi:hypothetical protein